MRHRSRLSILMMLCGALSAPLVAQQAPFAEATRLLAAGNAALDEQRFHDAREAFERGMASVSAAIVRPGRGLRPRRDDVEVDPRAIELRERLRFHLALAHQIEGEREGNDATLLSKAAALYRQVLEAWPQSGSTLVNLAQIEEHQGNREAAEALLRQAVALDDEKKPIYEEKYAEFLAAGTSDKRRAIEVYLQLWQRQPGNPKAEREILTYYLDPRVGEHKLPQFLWKLIDEGQVLKAQEAALRVLEQTADGWSDSSREEFLGVVAASLGRQFQPPEAFRASELAERLRRLREDAKLGPGVAELLRLYDIDAMLERQGGEWRAAYSPEAFPWWRRETYRWADGERGVWLRDAFRGALRAVGSWYETKANFKIAEACYETAALIAEDEIDPRSVRALADLYVREKRIDQLKGLADKFQIRLIEAKNNAYQDAQIEKIYEFHRTLGGIYGNLALQSGDWGDSRTMASAIFQLEHAHRTGKKLERTGGKEELYVDPGLVNLLAQGYVAQGRVQDGNALRLEAAEEYRSKGRLEARDAVLRAIKLDALDEVGRVRLAAVEG